MAHRRDFDGARDAIHIPDAADDVMAGCRMTIRSRARRERRKLWPYRRRIAHRKTRM